MSHSSAYPPVLSRASESTGHVLPPQLPPHIELWSTRALAAWLDVSTSTVKYHARQAFRGHNGRWEFNGEQAQRVVNRIFQFGQVRTLNKATEDALSEDALSEEKIADIGHLDSPCGVLQKPDLKKSKRLLDGY